MLCTLYSLYFIVPMVPVSVLAVPLVTMLEVEEISGIWQGVHPFGTTAGVIRVKPKNLFYYIAISQSVIEQ